MPRPSHASAVGAIYATVAQPERWPDTLALLADHIGVTGGMIAYSNYAGSGSFLTTARLREDLTELYVTRYTGNPWARAMNRVRPGQVVLASDLADVEAIRRSAFHADILAPQAIEENILVGHPALTTRSSSGGFSFTLDAAQAQARDVAARRFQRLSAHMSRAFDLSLEVGRKLEAARGLEALLEALPGAALLLDRRCRVRQTNARADALLARRDGLSIDGEGRLVATFLQEGRDLAPLLRAAVSVAAGEDGPAFRAAVKITRPSLEAPMVLVATPLPPATFAVWAPLDTGARALVQVVDPTDSLEGPAGLLREVFGLTATEARVAGLVAEGRTTPEVAALLGLSPATVRTHLARCFDKSGSRSQVALARLLASLPG